MNQLLERSPLCLPQRAHHTLVSRVEPTPYGLVSSNRGVKVGTRFGLGVLHSFGCPVGKDTATVLLANPMPKTVMHRDPNCERLVLSRINPKVRTYRVRVRVGLRLGLGKSLFPVCTARDQR